MHDYQDLRKCVELIINYVPLIPSLYMTHPPPAQLHLHFKVSDCAIGSFIHAEFLVGCKLLSQVIASTKNGSIGQRGFLGNNHAIHLFGQVVHRVVTLAGDFTLNLQEIRQLEVITFKCCVRLEDDEIAASADTQQCGLLSRIVRVMGEEGRYYFSLFEYVYVCV